MPQLATELLCDAVAACPISNSLMTETVFLFVIMGVLKRCQNCNLVTCSEMLKIWDLVLGELHQGIWAGGGRPARKEYGSWSLKDHRHVNHPTRSEVSMTCSKPQKEKGSIFF